MTPSPHIRAAADACLSLFEGRDRSIIMPLLADDVELRPPTYGKSWKGSNLVFQLLWFAAESLDGLIYKQVLFGEDSVAMHFVAEVNGRELSGIDMLTVNGEGCITLIEIFSRPPKVALELLSLMTTKVEGAPHIGELMRQQGHL